MDLGHGGRGTAHAIQERDGERLGQNWINNQEIFFVAQSGRTEFGGKDKEILGIKDGDHKGCFLQKIYIGKKYYGSLGNLLKLFLPY